jgi:hypothetical protein
VLAVPPVDCRRLSLLINTHVRPSELISHCLRPAGTLLPVLRVTINQRGASKWKESGEGTSSPFSVLGVGRRLAFKIAAHAFIPPQLLQEALLYGTIVRWD